MYIASLKEAKSLAEMGIKQTVSAESFNESVEYTNRKYKAQGASYAKLALIDTIIQDAIMETVNTLSCIRIIEEGKGL